MSGVSSSAPGKVVLAGEYAVLDGAAAIAMAVNRRAVVSFETGSRLSLRCVGLDGVTDRRLFDCVRNVLSTGPLRGTVVMDTGAFVDSESAKKFGVGSSAALSVALVRALAAGDIPDLEFFRLARKAHSEFQNGAGSGVDVATSMLGGLVEYRIGDAPRRLPWPDGLHFALLWSGVPSSTADKLGRLAASEPAASRAALGEASGRIAASWSSADAAAVIRGYRDYVESLRQFDIDHGLGIFDAGHDGLVREAASADVIYKPCGAGGGDIGVVLGVDQRAVRAFVVRAAGQGFRQLDLTLDRRGVELKRSGA